MLRPEEISNEQFELSVLGGYKREQVDVFFESVTSDYEKLYKENAELISKLKVCVEKIDEYQKDEQFLKAAIINAEKLNETSLRDLERKEKEIETSAREKAEGIVAKAKLDADEILSSAKLEADNIVKKAQADAAEAIRTCEIETSAKIAELKAAQDVEETNLNNLRKEVSDFKENVLKLYKQHLNSLSKLPEYEAKVKEKEKVEVAQAQVPVFEQEVQQAENVSETIKEESIVKPDQPVNEKTAEFVIEKSAPVSKLDEQQLDRNFKFKDLKFGTDFDIKNEK